jgi:hypothetical protein
MKIVMVSGHSCIRVHKIALPLIDLGHEVHLIAGKNTNFSNLYRTFHHYHDIIQCTEAIRLHRDADIVHCHNEPSWFVYAAKELVDCPVILDAHDSYLTRSTSDEHDAAIDAGQPHVRVTAEERAAFQAADGINFVSETMRETVVSEFGLTQPVSVLPSFVPRGLYRYHFKEYLGGLCYEGRVVTPDQHEALRGATGSHYCDYTDVAQRTRAIDMDFHLYAGREDSAFQDHYGPIALIHRGYRYDRLLDQISRHDWGLVGNTVPSPQWSVAMPNKLFDYIAAGVPPVVIQAWESERFVDQTGLGIAVASIDDLAKRWSDHEDCRRRLLKDRQKWTMDAHIDRLLNLYREVL